MSELFHLIFYQPLFNALVWLYETMAFGDLGIAIILLTIIIRLIFYPLFYRTYKNQTILQRLQPEIKKIQHDHKGSRERQAQALLTLYREHKVNPFASFFLILIQLPILIALYRVFLNGFSQESFSDLYSFFTAPAEINNTFLNLIDLGKPAIVIVGLAALAQYFQGRISMPKPKSSQDASPAERVGRQMIVLGPVLTLIILYSLPAAIGLYWITTSVFSVLQQILINRSLHGSIPDPNKNPS